MYGAGHIHSTKVQGGAMIWLGGSICPSCDCRYCIPTASLEANFQVQPTATNDSSTQTSLGGNIILCNCHIKMCDRSMPSHHLKSLQKFNLRTQNFDMDSTVMTQGVLWYLVNFSISDERTTYIFRLAADVVQPQYRDRS